MAHPSGPTPPPKPPPELYIVATPIGNLGDITARAIETLRRVDWVLAEDTRRTRALLSYLGISKQVTRVDAHSSPSALQSIVERIVGGRSAALVSDAGVPAVSDPGALLVAMATASGVKVVSVPGPSAVTAAVAVSGFTGGAFFFMGFLARKGKERRRELDRISAIPEQVVLFESPHRLAATLAELAERTPDRQAMVGRELTKQHEELVRGTLADLAQRSEWRGEITLVLASMAPAAPAPIDESELLAAISAKVQAGHAARDIARELALSLGLPRREIYERVLDLRAERVAREQGDGRADEAE